MEYTGPAEEYNDWLYNTFSNEGQPAEALSAELPAASWDGQMSDSRSSGEEAIASLKSLNPDFVGGISLPFIISF